MYAYEVTVISSYSATKLIRKNTDGINEGYEVVKIPLRS